MKDQLKSAMKVSMKAGEKTRVETIRAILSAIQYEESAQNIAELPATGVTDILKRELKKRKEELEFAEQAKRPETIAKLHEEMSVVESFLPQQMSPEDLEKVIRDIKAKDPAMQMGVIMKTLKDAYSGQYDAKLASEIVKKC